MPSYMFQPDRGGNLLPRQVITCRSNEGAGKGTSISSTTHDSEDTEQPASDDGKIEADPQIILIPAELAVASS